MRSWSDKLQHVVIVLIYIGRVRSLRSAGQFRLDEICTTLFFFSFFFFVLSRVIVRLTAFGAFVGSVSGIPLVRSVLDFVCICEDYTSTS